MTRRRLPRPRWQTPMPANAVGSWGPYVAEYARLELGIELDLWQKRALNRALATDADGRLVHRHYLASAGRQNGKTVLVRSLIGTALTAPDFPRWATILGLAHDKKQARIPYAAVLADLEPIKRRVRRDLHLTRYLGIRSDLHGWHREYDVGSREARDAIRSLSVDLGVFDEVRTQRNYDTWSALEPTTRARPEPLIFSISTAGDDRSVLLRDWFERGLRIIAGAEPAQGFGMTWYAAPDDLDPTDPRAILAANPAVAEGRLPIEPVAASFAAFRKQPAKYLTETLNLWSEGGDELLPPGVWRDRIGPQPSSVPGRLVLAVEAASTWRRATIVVAIETAAGAWIGVAGALDAARFGASSLAPDAVRDELERLIEAWRPDAVAVVSTAAVKPYAQAAAEARRVQLLELTATHIRAASELWRSELVGGRLEHEDDPLMAQQLRTARPSRAIEGGDWYLSIRESLGDIDSVRAGAWAAWGAIAPEARKVKPQIFA